MNLGMSPEEISISKVAEIKTLEEALEVIIYLLKENHHLRERIAVLEKNSNTSSKPPSSDIVKQPSEQRQPGVRKSGAQPGHKGHFRKKLSADKVDDTKEFHLEVCPECGEDKLEDEITENLRVQQVAELPERSIVVTEYRMHGRFCPCCGIVQYPKLPEGIIPNQVMGTRLLSLIGYMKGNMSISLSELQQFLRYVIGLTISQGTIGNAIFRVSDALAKPYDEVAKQLQKQESLHVDETGWKDCGKKLWVWLFCSGALAFFTIQNSRGCKVLKQVLGETFPGAITSDFYSAYVCYANALQQFCLAHLIRDIKFLTTLPCLATVEFGNSMLAQFKQVFALWHNRSSYEPDYFVRDVNIIKHDILTLISGSIPAGKATTMQRRLLKHWDSIFRFLAHPELLQPTNNLAERTLRHLVKMRRVSQGSRGTKGQLWVSRIMTVLETCKKQNRNPWEFIQLAVNSHFFNIPAPTLVIKN